MDAELKMASKSTLYRKNIEWFNEHYIERTKDEIEFNPKLDLSIGKIYTYNYDPKYADKLDFYDNQPIMLCLGHISDNAFGINLSFIPQQFRIKILDKIYQIFLPRIIANQKQIDKKKYTSQKPIPTSYEICKIILNKSGFEFALRSYIYERIKTKPLIVSYQDWWRICTFSSQYIQKLNIQAINFRYKKAYDSNYRIGDIIKPKIRTLKLIDIR